MEYPVPNNPYDFGPPTSAKAKSSGEIVRPDYRFLDQDLRMSLTRLSKGELLLQHAVFRQPVKIIFPKPAYKQESMTIFQAAHVR